MSEGRYYRVSECPVMDVIREAQRFPSMLLSVSVRPAIVSGLLDKRIGGGYRILGDDQDFYTTYERHGDTYILSVPAQCEQEPPNCTPLKMSEYWAIREAASEKAEQATAGSDQ